jgi:hypothetical protein
VSHELVVKVVRDLDHDPARMSRNQAGVSSLSPVASRRIPVQPP